MKVIANIEGWKKEIEAPPDAFYRGWFYVAIYPPLTYMVRPSDLAEKDDVIKVMLQRTGDREFSYRG